MMRGFIGTILALTLLSTAFGQSPERSALIDVQKYTIDADINPRTQSIAATAKISFTAVENTSEVTFELNNALNVTKVVDAQGTSLSGARNAQDFTVKVTFPSTLQKGASYEVSLTYDGKLTGTEDSPVYGLKFAALHP